MYKTQYSEQKELKLFPLFCMLFVLIQIVSDLLNYKHANIFGTYIVTTGIIAYPLIYSINDIVTEVYGYVRARRMIWCGLLCILIFISIIEISIIVPPAPYWKHQMEFESVLGSYPRFGIAGITAYFISSFLNSYILSKTKLAMHGKYLLIRLALASIVGITVSNTIYLTMSFVGTYSIKTIINVILTGAAVKICYDLFLIPMTILIIKVVKSVENVDTYDYQTKFTPFSLSLNNIKKPKSINETKNLDPLLELLKKHNDACEFNDPCATICFMATTDEKNKPSVRAMAIRKLNQNGITLMTGSGSKKYSHLLRNNWCEILFWWSELNVQYRISGHVEVLSADEAYLNWKMMPYEHKILYLYQDLFNHQSSVIASTTDFYSKLDQLQSQYPPSKLTTMPKSTVCLSLKPEHIEVLHIETNKIYRNRKIFTLESGNWIEAILVP